MVSLFSVDDHHVEVSRAESGGSKGREVLVILDPKVLQELLGEVGVVVASEDVVVGVEKDYVFIGLRRALLGSPGDIALGSSMKCNSE